MISQNKKSLNLDNIKGLSNLSDSQAEMINGGWSGIPNYGISAPGIPNYGISAPGIPNYGINASRILK